MATPSASRPLIVGPDEGPSSPYPLQMEGKVISGFGRGSKELGIPTANLPVDSTLTPWIDDILSGVYFGFASLNLPADHPDRLTAGPHSAAPFLVFPMVMSIGYNPFYKNTVRSAEVHVLHNFTADFYDSHMRLLILGFIRPEQDYSSLDALVADINFDCDVARASVARPNWAPPEAVCPLSGAEGGKLDGEWLVKALG